MLTVCVVVAVFPTMSVAVHVTIVFPIGKNSGALFSTEITPTASLAVGISKSTEF